MRKVILWLAICFFTAANAQVSISTNLLHTIPLNRPLIFEVRINKGQVDNFAKFQMDVDQGITVKEVYSKGGSFLFEENKVKIVWSSAVAGSEIAIRMKILPVSTAKKITFIFKYFYVKDSNKMEYICDPLLITFKDTVMPVLFSAPMLPLPSKSGKIKNILAADTSKKVLKNPELVREQIRQLKKDSRDAYAVGEEEKKRANLKLKIIAESEKNLSTVKDPAERSQISQKLSEEKKLAQEELSVAKRVLVLAKTLEANANEIERIANTVDPDYTKVGEPASKPKSVSGKLSGVTTDAEPSAGTINTNNVLYRVQVAASKANPQISQFKKFGKVTVVKENETYKVLVGNFYNKDEAYKLRDQLSGELGGCFVVSYLNGVRTN